MKNIQIVLVAMAITWMLGCSKTSNSGEAQIRFVNLSPNSTNVNLIGNGALVAGGIAYGSASTYKPISSSNPAITVNTTGVTQPLFSGNLSIKAGMYYSFFVFDSTTKMKVSLVIDDQTAPPAGKANIRFLNFYNGAVAVDVKKGGSTNLFISRTTNDHTVNGDLSKYIAIDPGTFTLSAVVAGSSVVLIQLPSFATVAGKSYTMILRGSSSVTTGTQAITLDAITDK